MTKELLEQYPDICAELADLERAARTPVSDVVSGSSGEYPYTQHAVTIRGLPAEQHRARIERLKRQKLKSSSLYLHCRMPGYGELPHYGRSTGFHGKALPHIWDIDIRNPL